MNNKLFLVMSLVVFSSFDVKSMSLTAAAISSSAEYEKYLPQLIGAAILLPKNAFSQDNTRNCQVLLASAFNSAYFKDKTTLVLNSKPNLDSSVSSFLTQNKDIIRLKTEDYDSLTDKLKGQLQATVTIELSEHDPKLSAMVPILLKSFKVAQLAAAVEPKAGDTSSYTLVIINEPADNLLTKFNQ